MSSHLYGFGAAAQSATSAATAAALSSVYSSRALTDSYLSDPALRYYSGSDPFADHHTRASSMYLPPHLIPHSAWPAPDVEPGVPGVKRPSEGLFFSLLCYLSLYFNFLFGYWESCLGTGLQSFFHILSFWEWLFLFVVQKSGDLEFYLC